MTHNLDEQIVEYFDFILKGHTYRFRHLTIEELEKVQELKDNEKELRLYLFQFIDKVNPESPDFPEIAKKMIAPQWMKFAEMLKAEFSA